MPDHHPQLAGRARVEPPAQVLIGGEVGALFAGGADPAVQPSRRQLGPVRTEPPRAVPAVHGRAEAFEGLGGDGHGVRPEQAAAAVAAPLVGVERGGDLGVERVARGQLDPTGDGQGEQRRAAGADAGVGERVHLVGGEQVQQGRRRYQGGASEVGGAQLGEVAEAGLDGAGVRGGEGQQVGVAVVQDPVLWAGQAVGKPPPQRPGAAAEVPDDQRPGGQVRAQRVQELGRPRVGVGGLAQGQPRGVEPGRIRLAQVGLADSRSSTAAILREVSVHPASVPRRPRAASRRHRRFSCVTSQ